jgi:hypothetical protein
MKLDRVTITGADDSVDPVDLLKLSAEFPFVEWALLFKHQNDESPRPRWPRLRWFETLFELVRGRSTTPQFALHLCGMPCVRFLESSPSLFSGDHESVPGGLLQLCRRIQLNTHGEPHGWAPPTAIALVSFERLPLTEIICQIDGGCGISLFRALAAEEMYVFPFYDLSHGAGVLPKEWPANYLDKDGSVEVTYCGYGGGLGPENVEQELPRIAEAAGGRFWIDMETKVRSQVDGRDVFDLEKVRRVLEICAPYVEG